MNDAPWLKLDPLTARMLCRSCWNSEHPGCSGHPCECHCSGFGRWRKQRKQGLPAGDSAQMEISMDDCLYIGPGPKS